MYNEIRYNENATKNAIMKQDDIVITPKVKIKNGHCDKIALYFIIVLTLLIIYKLFVENNDIFHIENYKIIKL